MAGVPRRTRIWAVGILVTNTTIAAMDHHLGSLGDGDLPRHLYRGALGVGHAGGLRVAFSANGPAIGVCHYMLWFFHFCEEDGAHTSKWQTFCAVFLKSAHCKQFAGWHL